MKAVSSAQGGTAPSGKFPHPPGRSGRRITMRWLGVAVLLACGISVMIAADDTKISAADAKKLKSPVANTEKSIDRGKLIFGQNCTGCHGEDGKAEVAIIAEATNLTAPDRYKNGTSEGEIFRSIRDGAGVQMPPFKYDIAKEEDLWNLVNFIRSLWPESMRPPVQSDKK